MTPRGNGDIERAADVIGLQRGWFGPHSHNITVINSFKLLGEGLAPRNAWQDANVGRHTPERTNRS